MSTPRSLTLLVTALLILPSCGSGDSLSTRSTTPITTGPQATLPTTATTTTSAPAIPPPAVPTFPPRDAGAAILVAAPDGVWLIAPDGSPTLVVDQPAAYAIDDTRGGVLFQTDRGRRRDNRTWDTVVWWIPHGQTTPRELLVPTPGTDHELWLHDAFVLDGHLNVMYTRSEGVGLPDAIDRLRRYDVEMQTVIELYVQGGWETYFDHVWHADGVIGCTRFEMFGQDCVFLAVDVGSPPAIARPERPIACLRDGGDEDLWCPDSCVLSDDGSRLVYRLARHGVEVEDSQIVVTNASTGAELARIVLPHEEGAHTAGLDLLGNLLLVNRRSSQGEAVAALVVDVDQPGAEFTPLPVAGQASFLRSEITQAASATEVNLIVAGAEGVVRWSRGEAETLVDEPNARVAFELPDGSLVYQLHGTGEPQTVMIARRGVAPAALVATDGVIPRP